jgi:diguanylate cyclase (GGDEF)-like protein/PAS domain S-box-containing protein
MPVNAAHIQVLPTMNQPADISRQPPRPQAPSVLGRGFDTTNCEREPIHAPGAIQPHGALLAVCVDSLLVSHASANLAAILGCDVPAVLGSSLEQAVSEEACRALLGNGAGESVAASRVHVHASPGGNLLYLQAHRCGGHLCVDIEPMSHEPLHNLPIIEVQAVLKTFEFAATSVELCELAVHGLKKMAGYGRVMAYRFAPDGHGEVIAEARDAHLQPFLGLRYPASDIPPQARQLFLRQRVGMIADAKYEPVPLLVDPGLDDGMPLDLTRSALRSVSPVHCEYMRNMGTAASLTVGLGRGQQLWGMLVCHHETPRLAGPSLRAAAGTIGQVVSLMLASLNEAEVLAQRLERTEILRRVVDRLSQRVPLLEAFAAGQEDLLNLVNASGAIVRISGACVVLGRTPPAAAAEEALIRVSALAHGRVLAIEDLGERMPELDRCILDGSGALLLPLAPGSDDAILWFRPEVLRTVTWGGDPGAHGSIDPVTARISPRASFAAWQETVRGRSVPWTAADCSLARELREAVQAEVAQRMKAALLESEARLGLLAEHSGVVVMLSDLDGRRTYVSPAAERVIGWRPNELLGRAAQEFVHPDDQEALHIANRMLQGERVESSATYRFRRPDGSWLWVDGHARLRPRIDGERPTDYVVVLRDATERKADEARLLEALNRMEQMAATDGLTGLANRRYLDKAIEREWRRCAREHQPLSALLLDVDHFKLFNDRYGHLAGDDCLRVLARQLTGAALRPDDVVARYGGEEFVVLLPGTGREGARQVAMALCKLVHDQGIVHAGNDGFGVATVSIGTATVWPSDPSGRLQSAEALLSAADQALYQAKNGGRNQVKSDIDLAAEH